MSNKGNYYIVYPNGVVDDEFGNNYEYDKTNLLDLEGEKHEIYQEDIFGIYTECSTQNEKVVFQDFSLSFEVNVSATVTRASNHDAHIIPFSHNENTDEPVPDEFYDFVESEFGQYAIVANKNQICPEVHYEITPDWVIKIKSKEKNLPPIREMEADLKLAPIDEDKSIEKVEKSFAEMVLLFEGELKTEISKLISHLFHELHIKTKDNEIRNAFIAEMIKAKERDVRRRIPVQKGRTPINQQKDFEIEKEKFINQCFEAFDELKAKKRKLNRTELAEILFNDSNPMQTLRRRWKSLEITFEEVLRQYTEQKPS